MWLNLCRELYNAALEERISSYKITGKSLSTYDQHKHLPKVKEYRPEFKNVNSQTLQNTIEKLGKAYDGFFRRIKLGQKAGFPRFKSRDRYRSFTLVQHGWKLDGKFLYIKKVGRFKLYKSREIEGDIKTVTVKRDSCGDWFVTFSCDNVPMKPSRQNHVEPKEIGIDVGIKEFLTTSDGDTVSNPKHFVFSQKKLKIKQRSLCRKKKGGNRRKKQRKIVAKHHRKITRQRDDFQWKTAKKLVDENDVVFVENLKISNMIKNHCLSKAIADVSWASFISKLLFKAEEAGKEVIKVNPRNTSQMCSGCGCLVKKSLAVRTHDCPECGLILDRDLNAAINIKRVGQTRQALTKPVAVCVA